MKHETFKQYPPGTKVKIIATGEIVEAKESLLDMISLIINDKIEIYLIKQIEFL